MKRELPPIFQNKIAKPLNNNAKVFYGECRDSNNIVTVDSLFKQNEVYRTNVKITLTDRVIEKKVIGRTKNNLITLDNEIIPISDINKIELL